MDRYILPGSDLRVTRLGVGGCPFGGHGWGQVRQQEMTAAIHAALDSGLNFFDTADVYGLGVSESLLGNALKGRRHRAVVATKGGVRVESGVTFYDNSPQWLRAACEGSLRRLGTDCIDIYQLHYRDGTPVEQILDCLEALRREGKIRYFGLSNVELSQLPELLPHRGRFVTVQNHYSLAQRRGEAALLRLSRELGASPMTWGSLGQGVLTGKYGPDAVFPSDDRRSRETYVNFRREYLTRNLRIVDTLRPIAADHGVSVAAVAVRFILDNLPGSIALCGVKRPEQLLTDALGWRLSEEELARLRDVSAPLPSPGIQYI